MTTFFVILRRKGDGRVQRLKELLLLFAMNIDSDVEVIDLRGPQHQLAIPR
jgi:hypothetical protein